MIGSLRKRARITVAPDSQLIVADQTDDIAGRSLDIAETENTNV